MHATFAQAKIEAIGVAYNWHSQILAWYVEGKRAVQRSAV